jgi:hypothetical protein
MQLTNLRTLVAIALLAAVSLSIQGCNASAGANKPDPPEQRQQRSDKKGD